MGLFDFVGDIFGGSGKSDSMVTSQNDIRQLPDYQESTDARQLWGDTLKNWSTQPGYGAIAPNWGDIWSSARDKVSRYFNGGPEGPGLNAIVKANSARRGVSENPAGDTMLQRSGFQEGNTLADIAVKQAMEQAAFGEKGRENWLGSLQSLSGLKPSFSNFGTTQETQYAQPNPVLGGGGMGGFDINQLSSIFGGGDGGSAGIGDPTGASTGDSGGTDWVRLAMDVARMFGGDFSGAPDAGVQIAGLF